MGRSTAISRWGRDWNRVNRWAAIAFPSGYPDNSHQARTHEANRARLRNCRSDKLPLGKLVMSRSRIKVPRCTKRSAWRHLQSELDKTLAFTGKSSKRTGHFSRQACGEGRAVGIRRESETSKNSH